VRERLVRHLQLLHEQLVRGRAHPERRGVLLPHLRLHIVGGLVLLPDLRPWRLRAGQLGAHAVLQRARELREHVALRAHSGRGPAARRVRAGGRRRAAAVLDGDLQQVRARARRRRRGSASPNSPHPLSRAPPAPPHGAARAAAHCARFALTHTAPPLLCLCSLAFLTPCAARR
jgi:hypothetical protein